MQIIVWGYAVFSVTLPSPFLLNRISLRVAVYVIFVPDALDCTLDWQIVYTAYCMPSRSICSVSWWMHGLSIMLTLVSFSPHVVAATVCIVLLAIIRWKLTDNRSRPCGMFADCSVSNVNVISPGELQIESANNHILDCTIKNFFFEIWLP